MKMYNIVSNDPLENFLHIWPRVCSSFRLYIYTYFFTNSLLTNKINDTRVSRNVFLIKNGNNNNAKISIYLLRLKKKINHYYSIAPDFRISKTFFYFIAKLPLEKQNMLFFAYTGCEFTSSTRENKQENET